MAGGGGDAGVLDSGEPNFGVGRECAHGVVEDGGSGLGRAGGEDEVEGVAAEESGQLLPRFTQGGVCPRADTVETGGVADVALARGQPSVARGGVERGGCVVVEVEHGSLARAGADESAKELGEVRVAVVEALGVKLDGLQEGQERRVFEFHRFDDAVGGGAGDA